jgi:hypothetical protein
MNWFREKPENRRSHLLRSAAIWLCLGLIAVLSIAQVAHCHKDAAHTDNCAICVVLQHAAPMAAAALAIVLVAVDRLAPAAFSPCRIGRSPRACRVRPPPAN